MITGILIDCSFGFSGFQDPQKKYFVARLDDNDFCGANGFLTVEWGINACGPVVTESTRDYAEAYPLGSVFDPTGVTTLDVVDSDTFSYYLSICPDPNHPEIPIKISWTLSKLITF
jgi:hypothetical protein